MSRTVCPWSPSIEHLRWMCLDKFVLMHNFSENALAEHDMVMWFEYLCLQASFLDENSQKFFMKLNPHFHGKFSLFPHSTLQLSLSTLNYFNFYLWKPIYFDCGCMRAQQKAQRHQWQHVILHCEPLNLSLSPPTIITTAKDIGRFWWPHFMSLCVRSYLLQLLIHKMWDVNMWIHNYVINSYLWTS